VVSKDWNQAAGLLITLELAKKVKATNPEAYYYEENTDLVLLAAQNSLRVAEVISTGFAFTKLLFFIIGMFAAVCMMMYEKFGWCKRMVHRILRIQREPAIVIEQPVMVDREVQVGLGAFEVEYFDNNVPALRQLLRQRGLPDLGNRVDLIRRLRSDDNEIGLPGIALTERVLNQELRRRNQAFAEVPPPELFPTQQQLLQEVVGSGVNPGPVLRHVVFQPTGAQTNYARMLAGRLHTEVPIQAFGDRA
jgi:hypothetical protein